MGYGGKFWQNMVHWRREWQTTSVFLPWEPHEQYAYVRSLPFLSSPITIVAWNVPLISPVFLKRSLVFPILFFFPISFHCSLKRAFLSLFAIRWNSVFSWYIFPFAPAFHFSYFLSYLHRPHRHSGFPGGSAVKNPPAVWETWVLSPDWEDPLEMRTATPSSILAWRIPWTV